MFDEIIEKIKASDYGEAKKSLLQIVSNGSPKDIAYAYHLLGYIYTQYDFAEHDEQIANGYLKLNLNSEWPHPYAFYLFAQTEKDKNIALNYLRKGIEQYPTDPGILRQLLFLSPNKEDVIHLVEQSESTDTDLLGDVIEFFIESHQWDRIPPFISLFESTDTLKPSEKNFLDLLRGFALLLGTAPDYECGKTILKRVAENDIDNDLAYAHFLGLIHACIALGQMDEAVSYFDRVPISNTIHDFYGWDSPLKIQLVLEDICSIVFKELSTLFYRDDNRRLKAGVLYSLYLYSPSEDYDVFRYKKSDAALLTRFLKTQFNFTVACALFNMRCHFGQYREAFFALCEVLKHYHKFSEEDIYVDRAFEYANDEDLSEIAKESVACLKEDSFDEHAFLEQVFPGLIDTLYKHKLYAQIRGIADCFPDSTIIKTDSTFECAFSYGEIDHSRAIALYEKLIVQEPNNSAATNNLGVQYEHSGDLFSALSCYEKASALNKSNDRSKNNLECVKNAIRQRATNEFRSIAKSISLKPIENIGYNLEMQRKILTIQDKEVRDILARDLKECAIAVVAGQDKMATIMCGSIIEALLMQKIRERSIDKYDISQISKSKHATSYPVVDMGLNELLFVADQEKILDKNSYHLGHYIRDYRNIVHPAKEKRMSEEVSHENVLTMWAVLKRLLEELY